MAVSSSKKKKDKTLKRISEYTRITVFFDSNLLFVYLFGMGIAFEIFVKWTRVPITDYLDMDSRRVLGHCFACDNL